MSTSAFSIDAIGAALAANLNMTQPLPAGPAAHGGSFAQMLLNGIDRAEQKQKSADDMAMAFALDDSIPPHQVMFALDEAQSSMQMLLQVRSKIVEDYQEFMRMQL